MTNTKPATHRSTFRSVSSSLPSNELSPSNGVVSRKKAVDVEGVERGCCGICPCPMYQRGKSRTFGFRCVLCRHLPADHPPVLSAKKPSSSSSSTGETASDDGKPKPKPRLALYEMPAHKRRSKAVVKPKSFVGPDGEEYVSRAVYVERMEKKRNSLLLERLRNHPRPSTSDSRFKPLDTGTRVMTKSASEPPRPSTCPAPYSPINTLKDGRLRIRSLMSSEFSTATQKKAPSFKFSTASRDGPRNLSPTPAPGDHDALAAYGRSSMSRRAPAFSMGGRLKTAAQMAESLGHPVPPAPNAHVPETFVEENMRRRKGKTLGKKLVEWQDPDPSPGPATVVLESFADEGKRTNRGRTIGTLLPSHLDIAKKLGHPMPPGPGAHELDSFVDTNKRSNRGAFVTARLPIQTSKDLSPAPGDHDVGTFLDDSRRQNKGATLTSRGPSASEKLMPVSPGPAHDIRPRPFDHDVFAIDKRSPVHSLSHLRRTGELPRPGTAKDWRAQQSANRPETR